MRSGALRLGAVASVVVLSLLHPVSPSTLGEAAETAPGTPILSHAPGVAADVALDRLYVDSNAATLGRERAALGDCYAEDAMYLSEELPIMRGRQTIVDGFESWWRWLDEHEQRVVVSSARVVSRHMAGDLAYDVGYWRLVTALPDGETRTEVWKYSTIFRRGEGGRWLIEVENNLRAPLEAFEG